MCVCFVWTFCRCDGPFIGFLQKNMSRLLNKINGGNQINLSLFVENELADKNRVKFE